MEFTSWSFTARMMSPGCSPARAAPPCTSSTTTLPSVSTACFSSGVICRTAMPRRVSSSVDLPGLPRSLVDALCSGSFNSATFTSRSRALPARQRLSFASLPGRMPAMVFERSALCSTSLPLTPSTTSPGFTPAFCAGLPGSTKLTSAPRGLSSWNERASAASTSCTPTPMRPLTTLPVFTSWSRTCMASSMGTAKEIPMYPPLWLKIMELMPTTSPSRLNSGPPEFPGFTATSVWMNGTGLPPPTERDVVLTIPAVAVLSRPKGEPMASTHSPVLRFAGSPILTTGRSAASILITATSVRLSAPTSLAGNSRRSVRRTVISSASPTTCALVRMYPSLVTMKPEPMPRISGAPPCAPPSGSGTPKRRKKSRRASSPRAPEDSVRPTTSTFTTASPYRSTSSVKSGSSRSARGRADSRAAGAASAYASAPMRINAVSTSRAGEAPFSPGAQPEAMATRTAKAARKVRIRRASARGSYICSGYGGAHG